MGRDLEDRPLDRHVLAGRAGMSRRSVRNAAYLAADTDATCAARSGSSPTTRAVPATWTATSSAHRSPCSTRKETRGSRRTS